VCSGHVGSNNLSVLHRERKKKGERGKGRGGGLRPSFSPMGKEGNRMISLHIFFSLREGKKRGEERARSIFFSRVSRGKLSQFLHGRGREGGKKATA